LGSDQRQEDWVVVRPEAAACQEELMDETTDDGFCFIA
jgi:hypothetical protein